MDQKQQADMATASWLNLSQSQRMMLLSTGQDTVMTVIAGDHIGAILFHVDLVLSCLYDGQGWMKEFLGIQPR